MDDLPWTSLLDAYTCTECGRCTSFCPANLTGKLLSPRKIIRDTRDRVEEKAQEANGRDERERSASFSGCRRLPYSFSTLRLSSGRPVSLWAFKR